jgi:hypothetical protein
MELYAGNSRIGSIDQLSGDLSNAEIAVLGLLGVTAALTSAYLRLPLRIPGSSLVMAVLPIGLGLALVPRQLAGTTMAASALLTATVMDASGIHRFGAGALTSLVAIGPMLDLALARARSGWRLYLGFVAAGLAANVLAFAVRGVFKLFGFDGPGTRLFDDWLSQAAVTYVLAGGFAGLFSGACWFRFVASGGNTPRPR